MNWKTPALASLLAALVSIAASPAPASAKDGGDERVEVRTRVTCTRGTQATLRLRSEKGQIRIDLELDRRRQAGPWLVVVLHERQLVARTTLRAAGILTPLELRRTVPDWFGTDAIVIRATGPRGEMCRTDATI